MDTGRATRRGRFARVRFVFVAAFLSSVVGLAGMPARAYGVTVKCSGNGCNGTDPHATLCDQTAVRAPGTGLTHIWYAGNDVGYVELRFSTQCRTIWSRVFYTGGYGSQAWMATGVYRDPEPPSYDFVNGTCRTATIPNSFCHDYLTANSGVGSYGLQIYDGGYWGYAVGYFCRDSACTDRSVNRTPDY